tara:strand:+ start:1622 stop:1753 length:132 start_codon:yes stop_codon:yes gene_type:complete
MEQQSIPDMFICPISHDIMKEAVVDSEGNSYDKHYIEKWSNSV